MKSNNSANVSLGQSPANTLYRLASTGGGFTNLQRNPASLAGEAGEDIAQAQIIQQGVESGNQAINTGLNIYTDEKTRQYKLHMLDSLQATEQSLLGVTDPQKHKQIYQESMDTLKTDLSNFGIIKKDDLDYFHIFLSNHEQQLNKDNFNLSLQKAGNDAQDGINRTINMIDSVNMSHNQITYLLDNGDENSESIYGSTYQTLKSGGFSDDQSHKLATEQLTKGILASASSKANKDYDKELRRLLSEKDDTGEFKYFKSIQGKDRIDLEHRRMQISAQNDVNEIMLQHAQGVSVGVNYILSREDIDPVTKARLISQDNNTMNVQRTNSVNQFINQHFINTESWRLPISVANNEINNDSSIELIAKESNIPVHDMRQLLSEKHAQLRKKFESDKVGFLKSLPTYANLSRDSLVNVQKQSGIPNNEIQVLSNREEALFVDLYNRVKTPEEKLQVANFDHIESAGLLESLGVANTDQRKQFVEKYKYNILNNISAKQINPKSKVALEIMANNVNNDTRVNNIATTLFAQTEEGNEARLPTPKDRSDMEAFNKTPLMRYMLSHKDTASKAKEYQDVYRTSGVRKGDFINSLNKDVIFRGNKDIIFDSNQFSKSYINNTLDKFINNNQYYNPVLQKKPYHLEKVKRYGEWKNDGDNFKFVYNGVPYIYAEVDKDNKIIMPPIEYPLHDNNDNNNQTTNSLDEDKDKEINLLNNVNN